MAQQKSIILKGIQRALPQSMMPDGACQEVINARPRKGAWRPVGTKKTYKQWELYYDKIYIHDIDDGKVAGESNMIGYNKTDGTLYLIYPNQTPGSEHLPVQNLITREATPGKDVTVVFLKRTMIVTSESGVEVFLWTADKAYIQTASLPVPDVDLSINETESVITEPAFLASAVIGGYYAKLNEVSQSKGQMYGSIMYITAYRLFDGNYILHSIPRYFAIANSGTFHRANPDGGGSSDRVFDMRFNVSSLKATINNELYPSAIEATKDLIESICIFATKATTLHKIDETVITDAFLDAFSSVEALANQSFKNKLFVSDEFQNLAKSPGWYKIHEFPFEDVVGKTGRTTKEVDTKGFYQDYATRETLPADQFSHHSMSARAAYVYNDRLHLLNIKTSLGSPYVIWPDSNTNYGSLEADDKDGVISVWLKTSLGQAIVQKAIKIPTYREASEEMVVCGTYDQAELFIAGLPTNPLYPDYIAGSAYWNVGYVEESGTGQIIDEYTVVFRILTGSTYYLILPEIIGYNDARAYKMQITVTISGTSYQLFSETLVKNELLNFSFWHNTSFNSDITSATANYKQTKKLVTDIASYSPATQPPTPIFLSYDTNRLQVSEIQNPLVFPAKNSYQIGTGEGLAMCAGSEPLSTGQFGQFPLQVFTSKGIWALEIGTGEVLYTNVLPVNGEVINNKDNVTTLSQGVCYTSETGLFVINGSEVIELSNDIEQHYNNFALTESTEVQNLVSDARFTPSLINSLSTTNFIEYLKDSVIGYDHLNKELFVTNILHAYSYVYSFENQIWYKVSHSYRLLINSYPKLLGVTSSNIVSISEELDTDPIDCLFVTASQSLEAPDAYKKLERVILRALTHSSIEAICGFYIFGSDDLVTWKHLVGNQRSGIGVKDFLIHRTHGSVKYYAFVFAGRITTSSEIKQIELIFNIKWNNRLR